MSQESLQFDVDGQMVSATLHMPDSEEKRPAVLLCHGFTGSKIEAHYLFVKMSRKLESCGIGSLRFDFRGAGESEGRFQDMTMHTMLSDAREALGVLERTEWVDDTRIGLLGLSLGGCVAACASPDKRVKSLVLWAAVAHIEKIFRERFNEESSGKLKVSGTVDVGGNLLGIGLCESTSSFDPLAEISRCEAPVLIVHGEKDGSVPLQHAAAFRETAEKRGIASKLTVVPGADHTFANADLEREVIEATARWFEETL